MPGWGHLLRRSWGRRSRGVLNWSSWLRRSLLCSSSSGLSVHIEYIEISSDVHSISLFGEIFLDDSRNRGRNVNGDLVSLDSSKDLVSVDEISWELDELLDHSLRNRVSHLRHLNDLSGEPSSREVVEWDDSLRNLSLLHVEERSVGGSS